MDVKKISHIANQQYQRSSMNTPWTSKRHQSKDEHTTINLYTDDALDKVDSTYTIER